MFRALFETAPDAMIVVDRGGVILRANPQAARLFGHAIDALVGQPIEMLMPSAVRESHRAHLQRYRASPRVRPMGAGQELTGQRADGSVFPVEIALSPIDNDGDPVYLASIRDISETQRARQALVRAHYDTVLAKAGQLALEALDLEAAMGGLAGLMAAALDVDDVAIALTQPHRRELRVFARSAQSRLALPPSLRPQGALRRLLERGEPLQLGPADGEDEVLLASACRAAALVPLFDLDRPMGAVIALSGAPRVFDRDAVHFLQAVANLIAAAVQRGRTADQLAHAQRLDALGQLTGGIAHDFNNLLTVISGNLQLMEAQQADADAQALIESALRAVGRGADLTRKLLAFARRQRLSPRALAPQRLLEDLSGLLARTLGERIAIALHCADDLPAVYADPAELDAALLNLALNARDAMPRGGRLGISAVAERVGEEGPAGLAPGDYVVFTVADTGVGMPPEVLARALEPFFTTKEAGKGSGLGLSMVYGFVAQSGGAVHIDSQLGYGTRVSLYLPLAPQAEPAPARAAAGYLAAGRETVLVVEDEEDVRGIAVAFLKSLGYDVAVAADAESALALLDAREDIALVFTDVVLGAGATGTELLAELRRRGRTLPALLTSGYEPGAADGTEGVQDVELLRKPYRREELGAAVRRALDGGG